MTLIIGWPACQIIRYYCLYYFCYYCQFIIVYNFGVNVTVVIEHIVFFLLTAAGALISVSYVYLRLFFSVFVCLSFLSLLRNYELYVHHHRLPALMHISIW